MENRLRTIRISDEVWQAIAERGKFGETEDDVLRRVFVLPQDRSGSGVRTSTGPRGRGSRRHADKVISVRVKRAASGDQLQVAVENIPAKEWPLPNRSDKLAIKRVRDEAVAFGSKQGATVGQINAIQKALTEAGYFVRGPNAKRSRREVA